MYAAVCLAVGLLLGQAEPDAEVPAAEARPAEAPAAPAAEAPAREPAHPRADRPRAEGGEVAGSGQPAPPASARSVEPERTQVARAALAFLDPLVAGDAAALSRACGERFSFDGEVRAGREEIRRTFRDLLDRRGDVPPPALLDLELLQATEAVARLGPPPPRLAALAGARGGWIAIANLSRRPVVLFLAREGNRWVVVGMHG